MSIQQQAISDCRQALGMAGSRQDQFWADLDDSLKVSFLKRCGLPEKLAKEKWAGLGPEKRERIRQSILKVYQRSMEAAEGLGALYVGRESMFAKRQAL